MAPMIKPDRGSWAARLGLEAVVVVLSILLALFAREWWEGRETRERVDEAMRSIRTELRHNQEEIREAARYHQRVADRLAAVAGSTADAPHGGRGVRPGPAGARGRVRWRAACTSTGAP